MSSLDPNDYPASGGGWISGPMTAPVPTEGRDRRPEYSPASTVLDVRRALAQAGIEVDPTDNQLYVALLAAADLLRALGVKPTSAPER